MTKLQDRLTTMELLLGTVISQSAANIRPHPQFSPALSQPDTGGLANSNGMNSFEGEKVLTPPDTNREIADDTVDGMGVITFADEFASGHFGEYFGCFPDTLE